jgi:hypothetical protein
VTRAPTHCPYPDANQGINVTSNLNVAATTTTTSSGAVATSTNTVVNSNTGAVSTGTPSATVNAVESIVNIALSNPLTVEAYINESPASQSIG